MHASPWRLRNPEEEILIFKSVAQSEKLTPICGHSVIMAESKVVESSPDSDGAGTITDIEINEKSLLRKIDAKLLPAVGILYLLSFLDRSNGESAIECTAVSNTI